MMLRYSEPAARELDEILAHTAAEYPGMTHVLEQRLRKVTSRITLWPQSGRVVAERPDVRMVPLGRFPFILFYRINDDLIEILHIRHTGRTMRSI